MKAKPPLKISIYGSCVSRDMISSVNDNQYVLKRYIARQSLISAFSRPVQLDLSLDRLASPFQRRMVSDDLNGSLRAALQEISEDSNLLLWDLADERLGVYQINEQSYITRSTELITSGIDRILQTTNRLIPFGTDEHYNLWLIALERFAASLQRNSIIDRTFLLGVPWAKRNESGGRTNDSTFSPRKANRLYRRYIEAAEIHIPVIRLRQVDSIADSEHKWGPAPYHFVSDTYHTMDTEVRAHLQRLNPPQRRTPRPQGKGEYMTGEKHVPDTSTQAVGHHNDVTELMLCAKTHTFGRHFDSTPKDENAATALERGEVTLPPHPTVNLEFPIDWNAASIPDNNWRFNLQTLRWIDVLRRTGSPESDRAKLHQKILRSWLSAHQGTFEKPANKFVWNDMATGLRVRVLSGALSLHGPLDWIMTALQEHGAILANPEFGSQTGNHALHVAVGLLVAGDLLEHSDWTVDATSRIERLFLEGVDVDGVDHEGSTGYHATNYRWYKEARRHLRAASIRREDIFQRLDLMPDFLAYATTPAGLVTPIGDSDTRKPVALESQKLLYVRTRGQEGEKPTELYKIYKEAGYLFARTSWGMEPDERGHFYSLRFGPSRAVQHHAHNDAASVTLSTYRETVLHDAGRHKYDRSPLSRHLKSHHAHNGVVITEEDYDESSRTELLRAESTSEFDWTVVSRREAHGSLWTRGVYYSRTLAALAILDHVEGSGSRTFRQHWHFTADSHVEMDRVGNTLATFTSPSGTITRVLWSKFGQVSTALKVGETEPCAGWQSLNYGGAKEAPQFRIEQEQPAKPIFTIFDTGNDVRGPLEVDFDSNSTEPTDSLNLLLSRGKHSERLTINYDDHRIERS